jgi:hypothetical protein
MTGCFFSMRVFNDGVPGWKRIIASDGLGYYSYLPALFIDQDPAFTRVTQQEAKILGYPDYKPAYLVNSGDKKVNKYFTGEALLLLPFFLTALLFSTLTGNAVDGYSFFFQVFTGLGALFYLFLGLFFLRKILEYLHIRAVFVMLTVVSVLLGTNLFYYSLWQPSMSHVFSFFAINGFLWFGMQATRSWENKTAWKAGLFFGFVFLLRPTNVIVILLTPFLAGDSKLFLRFLKDILAKKVAMLIALSTFFIFCVLQMAAWYWQTGHLIMYSYGGEGFNFGHPEMLKVLFGYRKGLFLYTPLALFALVGLIPLAFRNWLQLLSMLTFLMTGTYIISSWWGWDYGDGFGLRAFIDFYGVFAILLALGMNMFRTTAWITACLAVLFTVLTINLVQTWQYTHKVMQTNNMNEVKYHHIFMRTDSAVINCLGGIDEIPNHNIRMAAPFRSFSTDFEKEVEGWSTLNTVESASAFSGIHAGYLDSVHPFSPGLAIRAGLLGKLPATYYLRGEVMVRDSAAGASNDALIVLSMDSIRNGKNWWQGFKMNDIPVQSNKTWRKITFSLMLPEISNDRGILKVYIWNTGKKPMLVDDFRVWIYGEGR